MKDISAFEKEYQERLRPSKIKALLNCLIESGKTKEQSGHIAKATVDYENCINSALLVKDLQHIALPILQKAANRLLYIYRKKEDIKNKFRILTLIIEVISKFNNESYQNALVKYPEHRDLIKESIEQHRGLYVDKKLIMQHIRLNKYISKLEGLKNNP
ncbi:MAG: hypothetical protein BGO31_06360 [Bacteroidetes bacterium 43-16]|nr:MAG: hypothetical protein BGO31_06360 [Bacteroidetes bacterium 43-16]